MEGRGGNKRNAELQSTVRTQSRSERKNNLILFLPFQSMHSCTLAPKRLYNFTQNSHPVDMRFKFDERTL
jgi:hypothetical protein